MEICYTCTYQYDANFMNYLNKNKKKISFVVLLLFLFLFTFLLTKRFVSLKILLLLPISLLAGTGLVTILKDILPIKNIFNYISFASFLSLFLNTCLIFFYGCLGGVLNNTFFIIYVTTSSLLSVTVFLLKEDENFISQLSRNIRLEVVDYIFIASFLLFFLLLLNIGLENYYPRWDSFTHWAIDAKYIYENFTFRTKDYDVLKYGYLPFYPLQLNYVYLLYGDMVEQFSGLLALLYTFLGGAIIISYNIDVNSKGAIFKKSLIYLTIFAAIYSLYIAQETILSQYADPFITVLVLFFGLVLFENSYKVSSYYKRFFLLFLLSVSLLLVKGNYSILTSGFLSFFFLYDFLFQPTKLKIKLNTPKFWIMLVLLGIYCFIVFFYRKQFLLDKNIVDYAFNGVKATGFFSVDRLLYLYDMYRFLFSYISLFICCYIALILLSLYSPDLLIKKQEIILFLFPFYILLFPFGFYILRMYGLMDMSLLRYVSVVFLLIPMLFQILIPNVVIKSKISKIFSIIVFPLIILGLMGEITVVHNIDFKFLPTTGKYKDFIEHKNYVDLSEKVLDKIEENASVMIVDQNNSGFGISNMDVPGIIIRYYLSNNSTGGQYSLPVDQWFKHFEKVKPDYLLVFTYDGYWHNCNNILNEGNTYLIKVDDVTETEEMCFIKEEDIIMYSDSY